MPTGQASPCINLARISERLALLALGADLVVMHGMGRAIHTNYYARCVARASAQEAAAARANKGAPQDLVLVSGALWAEQVQVRFAQDCGHQERGGRAADWRQPL